MTPSHKTHRQELQAQRAKSEKSNQLANYYSQMLEPFYDADRDEREKTIDKLRKWDAVRFEAQSNKLISLRNNSLVKRAECLFEEGEYESVDFSEGGALIKATLPAKLKWKVTLQNNDNQDKSKHQNSMGDFQ